MNPRYLCVQRQTPMLFSTKCYSRLKVCISAIGTICPIGGSSAMLAHVHVCMPPHENRCRGKRNTRHQINLNLNAKTLDKKSNLWQSEKSNCLWSLSSQIASQSLKTNHIPIFFITIPRKTPVADLVAILKNRKRHCKITPCKQTNFSWHGLTCALVRSLSDPIFRFCIQRSFSRLRSVHISSIHTVVVHCHVLLHPDLVGYRNISSGARLLFWQLRFWQTLCLFQ